MIWSRKLSLVVAVLCFGPLPGGAQQPTAANVHEFRGKVIAAQEAEIAARIDGRLAKINFTAGQIVKKGDLLFEFDQKFRQISLAGAQAKQKVLEAQLQLAEVKLKNTQTLRSRNVSSEMQLLETQAQRDIAAANVDEAKANVQAAQLQLDQTKLFAPIGGIIGRSFILEGAYLTLEALDKNRLAVITQLNPIQVVADVPFDSFLRSREMFDSRKQAGEMLEYTLVLPNGEKYPYKGRLVAGTGEFNLATQSMAIVVEFDNPEFLLRPGLAVKVLSAVSAR
jgi:RND family efflux transporter MFP subunit